MRSDILERRKDIELWISNNESKSFMCKELKCKPSTLDSYLAKMDIKYAGNKPMRGKPSPARRKTSQVREVSMYRLEWTANPARTSPRKR